MSENLTNLDGMLKDSYPSKPKGFQKAIHKCKKCGKMIKHSGGTLCSSCSEQK